MEEVTTGMDLTTSAQTVYSVPAGKKALIAGLQITNVDGADEVLVDAQWTDSSNSDKVTRWCYQSVVDAGGSLSPVIGSFTLHAGDTVEALASADNDAELTLTVIEEDA